MTPAVTVARLGGGSRSRRSPDGRLCWPSRRRGRFLLIPPAPALVAAWSLRPCLQTGRLLSELVFPSNSSWQNPTATDSHPQDAASGGFPRCYDFLGRMTCLPRIHR